MSIVTRFAPSPTGYLHLGHAASALAGHDLARAGGGRFLLRLEDIDAGRCRPGFAETILEDLTWLGLAWDGDVRVQSAHFDEYRAVLARLEAMGLLYRCFCTRAAIAAALGAPHGVEVAYPRACRGLDPAEADERAARGEPYALRLRMDRAAAMAGRLRYHEAVEGWVEADPLSHGDVVLARKDVPASYHLCVCHDDALQEVTHVTRGEDLRAATDVHVLLQALLGWPHPAYAHHPLIRDAAGRRLAKRDRAATLRDLREGGTTPAQIREMVSCRIGDLASL
jgi:glutamyl-Q tRNA(Asp) synthetase